MQANRGDRVIIRHQSGQPDRDGEVLEVRGANGAPPYVVRWEDSGHETYFFPVLTPPSSISGTSQPEEAEPSLPRRSCEKVMAGST